MASISQGMSHSAPEKSYKPYLFTAAGAVFGKSKWKLSFGICPAGPRSVFVMHIVKRPAFSREALPKEHFPEVLDVDTA